MSDADDQGLPSPAIGDLCRLLSCLFFTEMVTLYVPRMGVFCQKQDKYMVGILFYAHILRRIRPFSFCSIPCLFRSEPDQFSDNRTNYSNFY